MVVASGVGVAAGQAEGAKYGVRVRSHLPQLMVVKAHVKRVLAAAAMVPRQREHTTGSSAPHQARRGYRSRWDS